LPPVEPPGAGFIVQLFLVPGVIVVVVVVIWVLFNWLAQKGNDRDAFVRALSRNNEARWQAELIWRMPCGRNVVRRVRS